MKQFSDCLKCKKQFEDVWKDGEGDLVNVFCPDCDKAYQEIKDKIFNDFIQPERLSEKTSKEDAIV